MRNAVIRKKRLKAERIVDGYMRMRIIAPSFEFHGTIPELTAEDIERMTHSRIWALP